MKYPSEHSEQSTVIDWTFMMMGKYPELDLIFAVPNGASTGPIGKNSLKREGLRPGVCDLFLPCARGGFHGMFIEMKAHSGKLSENQEQFIAAVEKQGYYTAVCWGAQEAINQLEYYLGLEDINLKLVDLQAQTNRKATIYLTHKD